MEGTNPAIDTTSDRLIKEIGLRTFADRYLDQNEEREVIQIASQLGTQAEPALGIIDKACRDSGIVREVTVREAIRNRLSALPGKIDRDGFEKTVASTFPTVNQALTEREVRRLVVAIMEETKRSNVKHGWFSNWYVDQKRELGVV